MTLPSASASAISTTKKNVVVGKTFRLIDFMVYDQSPEIDASSASSSSETEAVPSPPREPDYFVIQMFGVNEKGETCCVYVNDYRPFFFAKVDDNWTQRTVDLFMQVIAGKREMQYHRKSIVFNTNRLISFRKNS